MDIKKRVNQLVRKYGTRNPLEIEKYGMYHCSLSN